MSGTSVPGGALLVAAAPRRAEDPGEGGSGGGSGGSTRGSGAPTVGGGSGVLAAGDPPRTGADTLPLAVLALGLARAGVALRVSALRSRPARVQVRARGRDTRR